MVVGNCLQAEMEGTFTRLSAGLHVRLRLSSRFRGNYRPRFTLLTLAVFLYSFEHATSVVSAFCLPSPTSRMSFSWQPRIRPLLPLLAASAHVDSASSANISEGADEDVQHTIDAGADTEVDDGALPQYIPMSRAGITAPMQHQPRGTRLIPGFPGPQFVSLRGSFLYRRRLRRHRRDEGWEFSNLPAKRNFFAARRNHRDQLMHKWIYTRHREHRRRAKEVRNVLQTQSREIFYVKKEEEHALEAIEQASDEAPVQAAGRQDSAAKTGETVGKWGEARDEAFQDCITSVRAALQSVPSAKVLSTMSSAALGRLHEQLRELLVDAVIAVAPPECVAAAASEGFSLPPPAAALAASPLPWWSSGGGLQPWRGRKVCWAQQSRRVNWASPRRAVEPMVAGVLLPKEAAAVVAAERRARNREILDSIRSFLFSPSTGSEGQTDTTAWGQAAAQQQETPCAAPAAASATPWFVQAEEERLQRLLRWDGGRVEEQSAPKCSSSSAASAQWLGGKARESAAQLTGAKGSARYQQAACGKATAVRRALGAAIDVALLLSEAIVTKKSGAAAPFSWESPFLRSSSSSRRRRRRQRGRPPPEERLPSRQARRLANRDRRIARQRANELSG